MDTNRRVFFNSVAATSTGRNENGVVSPGVLKSKTVNLWMAFLGNAVKSHCLLSAGEPLKKHWTCEIPQP